MSTPVDPNKLELVPMDEPKKAAPESEPAKPAARAEAAPPARADAASGAAAAPAAPADDVPRVDRFLARAAAEFRAGRIDQPLWTHVLQQSGGDEKLARSAYLRARATALQVAERDRPARPASGAPGGASAAPAQSGARAALNRLRATP